MKDLRKFIRKIIKEQIEGVGNLYITQEELNEVLKGYIEAALWTEEDNLKSQNGDDIELDNDEDDEEDEIEKIIRMQNSLNKKTFEGFLSDDIDADSKIQAYLDIKNFMRIAGEGAIAEALDDNGAFKLGMDIWLTRNHHGAGFFDHSYIHEDELMSAARQIKEVDMYISNDNRVVFSNAT
jgi:hypothetical protein